MMSGSHLSKDFFDLVKAIGESKSKQQEDTIIVDEVSTLKKKMVEANVSKKKMKEFLIRLVYVEMLGHDASFGYIKAIELAASKNLVQKRVGYLCSGLCLAPSHEFRFMLVNQLQQDMASANYLEVAASLSATLRLATADMIPALVDRVVKLGGHGKELVRKKVAMVLHRFYQLDKGAVEHLGDAMKRTLCDKDPSVMCAALCLLHDMIADEPSKFKELVPSFVSILKQVVEHRLPRDFDYHRIPAPWAQLRLLKVLAHLGRADQRASEGMYEVLSDVMRRADSGINAGYAIVYECVRTITTIYPNTILLDEAAKSISRFLASENNNLKYLGITGLAQVVEQHPKYAAQHQLAVIECLEDVDDTLKRKTLDLLYRMINPVNVEFIAQKLVHSLETSSDEFLRSALVSRLCTAAERFAPSNEWYVTTIIKILRLAGDLVKPDVAQNLVALIAENDDDSDDSLRASAVDEFADMLDWESVPEPLLHILSWVLGEYGSLCSTKTVEELLAALVELAADDARLRGSSKARALLLTAVSKMAVRFLEEDGQVDVDAVVQLATKFSVSYDLDVQQRCLEMLALMDLRVDVDLLVDVEPYDASLEDPFLVDDETTTTTKGDDALGFLDKFVASALAAGASPYAPPQDEDDDLDDADDVAADEQKSAFKFEAYEKPQTQHQINMADQPPPSSMPAEDYYAQQQHRPAGVNAIGPRIGAGGLSAASGPWGRPPPPQQQQQHQVQQQQQYHQQMQNAMPTQHAPPPPPAESPAEAPPELSEKERMAAALFGGVLNADEPSKKPQRRSQPSKKTPANSRAAKPPSAPKQPQAEEAAPAAQAAPPPAPPPPPPKQPEISLLDFTDEDFVTVPPIQPTTAASPLVIDDPFAAPPPQEETSSILAPAPLSTQDFGSRWGTCRQERKSDASPRHLQDVTVDFVQTALAKHAHGIEKIPATNELILAATHLASGTQTLVHAKILPTRKVQLTVRSTALAATQEALKVLVQCLEE